MHCYQAVQNYVKDTTQTSVSQVLTNTQITTSQSTLAAIGKACSTHQFGKH